ncbi:MAG: hypothetical protein FJZ01_19660 [Candidatus Sericytochromatia bacterium]|nr:hypothetical protein [Candidatus Tanganyikabacteria bacterium]
MPGRAPAARLRAGADPSRVDLAGLRRGAGARGPTLVIVALTVAISACGQPVASLFPGWAGWSSVVAPARPVARTWVPIYLPELAEREAQTVPGGSEALAAARLSAQEALPGQLVELKGVPTGQGTVRLSLVFPGGTVRRAYLRRVTPVRVAFVVPLSPPGLDGDVEAIGRLTTGSTRYAEFPIRIRPLAAQPDNLGTVPAEVSAALAPAVAGSGLAGLISYLGASGEYGAEAAGIFPEAAGHAAVAGRLSAVVGYRAAVSAYLTALSGELAHLAGVIASPTLSGSQLARMRGAVVRMEEIERTRLPAVLERYERMVLAAGDDRAQAALIPHAAVELGAAVAQIVRDAVPSVVSGQLGGRLAPQEFPQGATASWSGIEGTVKAPARSVDFLHVIERANVPGDRRGGLLARALATRVTAQLPRERVTHGGVAYELGAQEYLVQPAALHALQGQTGIIGILANLGAEGEIEGVAQGETDLILIASYGEGLAQIRRIPVTVTSPTPTPTPSPSPSSSSPPEPPNPPPGPPSPSGEPSAPPPAPPPPPASPTPAPDPTPTPFPTYNPALDQYPHKVCRHNETAYFPIAIAGPYCTDPTTLSPGEYYFTTPYNDRAVNVLVRLYNGGIGNPAGGYPFVAETWWTVPID